MAALGPFKIVILGEGRVGKTSLLKRFKYNTFDAHEASSQNATYLDKTVEDKKSGKEVKLALWDTAGQERFHSLAPIYYRDADGALIVYDITEPDTFKRVSTWVNELKTNGCSIPVSIVGNKYDMKTQQRVPTGEAEDFSRSIGARHSHASAKHARGVDEAFAALVESVVDHKSQAGAAAPGRPGRGGRNSRGPLIAEHAPAAPPAAAAAPRRSQGGGGQPQRASQSQAVPQLAATGTPLGAEAAPPAAAASAPPPSAAAKPRTSLFDDDDGEPIASAGLGNSSATMLDPAAAAAAAFPAAPAAEALPPPTSAPLPAPAAPKDRGFVLQSPAPKRGQVQAGGSFSSARGAGRKKEGCC